MATIGLPWGYEVIHTEMRDGKVVMVVRLSRLRAMLTMWRILRGKCDDCRIIAESETE